MSDNVLQKNFSVPIQMTDLSIFDDAYSSMKQRFTAEMRRVDEEMNKFGTNLVQLYGQTTTVQTSLTPTQKDTVPATSWETITCSPLVEGEGDSKSLKLQFDVSQFDPSEVNVRILNAMLVVTATHKEKTENTLVYREYNRQFLLPKNITPENIVSSISRDGILTVQVPLPQNILTDTPAPLRIGSNTN